MNRRPGAPPVPDDYLVTGDVGRDVQVTLTDRNGVAVNLTGATVRYILWPLGGTAAKVQAAATLVSPAAGVVKYTYGVNDLDTYGIFAEEWQVTLGGAVRTYPEIAPRYILIRGQMGS